MKRTIYLVIASLLIHSICAASLTWEGLDWTIRGVNNSAAIQTDGSIDISVLSGNSADPAPDNWVLTAVLPESTQWVRFSFIDTSGAAGTTVPRAYVDTSHDGGSTLIQGGGFSGYHDAYINRHWYKNGQWLVDKWINVGPRTANTEHSFMVGRRPDGSIDLYYDDVFKGTFTDVFPPDFNRVYLGVQAASGSTSVTGTYTSLSYGDTYIPEPATMGLLGLGSVLCRRKRRA